ncbi:carbon storage regulator [Pseudomonas chlororaphis]|uniref:carbon storage regulator n=1 Tax=Pseudomonas chlororaphis TaxID=587753 RepID=UPI00046E7AD6
MGYLILTRTVRQRIFLHVDANADFERLLHTLRTRGISIDITSLDRGQVKVGIDAPMGVTILRGEVARRS